MNADFQKIADKLHIAYEDIHLYLFVDERSEGWDSEFVRKAGIKGTDEQRILLENVSYDGLEMYAEGKLKPVLPKDWLPVFRLVNDDPNTLRPAIHWIAKAYLLHKGIITQMPPREEWNSGYGLNKWDNYYFVEYYVDTARKRIIPNCEIHR